MPSTRKRAAVRRQPLIIILAGAQGVGKTTLAHRLSLELGIHQRFGVGAIRHTLTAVLPSHPVVRDWYASLQDHTPAAVERLFRRRAQLVGRVVGQIVRYARKTSQRYLIEGVPLLPDYLPLPFVHYAVVTVMDPVEHQRRLQYPYETRTRHFRSLHIPTVRFVDHLLTTSARARGLPVINNHRSVDHTVRSLRRMFGV